MSSSSSSSGPTAKSWSAVLALCKPASSGTVPAAKLAGVAPELLAAPQPQAQRATAPPPRREADGTLVFAGFPKMRPNLTPAEVLRLGSFGGSYFRTIASGVTHKVCVDTWRELPAAWLAGLDVKRQVASEVYDAKVNRFHVKSGQDLRDWEGSGWIAAQDREVQRWLRAKPMHALPRAHPSPPTRYALTPPAAFGWFQW